jgi:hypothetical protein
MHRYAGIFGKDPAPSAIASEFLEKTGKTVV